MKQIITYSKEEIEQIVAVLNGLTITGLQNAKQLAVAAQILENGLSSEINELKEKEGD